MKRLDVMVAALAVFAAFAIRYGDGPVVAGVRDLMDWALLAG